MPTNLTARQCRLSLNSPARLAIALALAASCAATARRARADTWLWNGSAATSFWSDTNWTHTAGSSSSTIPLSSPDTTVNFAGSVNTATLQSIANPFLLNSLGFQSGAAAFAILSNPLDFVTSSASVAPTIVQNSANNTTILVNITLNNDTTISGSGTGLLVFNNPISGAGALIDTAAANVFIGSNNSYAGGTVITGGQITLSANLSLGTGNITFNSGTLIAGNVTLTNRFSNNNAAPIAFQAVANTTLTLSPTSCLFGSMDFGSATNNGTVILQPAFANDFGGTINVNGGTLTDGNGVLAQLLPAYNVAIALSATFNVNGFTTTFKNLTGAGLLQTGSNANETFTLKAANFSGSILGSGKLITGGGTILLSGPSFYTGGSTFNGGTVGVGFGTALSVGTVTVTADTVLFAANFNQTLALPFSLNANQSLTIHDDPNGAHNLTLAGSISGPGALVMNGTGTLSLPSPNSFSGGTTLSGGQLSIASNSSLGAGPITFNSGTIVGTANISMSNNFTTGFGGPMNFQAAANTTLTLNSIFSNFAAMNFGSAINNGTIIYQVATFGTIDGGSISVIGGTLVDAKNVLSTLPLDIAAIATFSTNGSNAVFVNLTGTGTLQTGSNAGETFTLESANFSGSIFGNGKLVTGGGTIILSGPNAYAGGTSLNGGTVGVGTGTSLATNTVTLTSNTSLFAANANQFLIPPFSLNANQTLTIQDDPNGAHNLTLAGIISGNGSLLMNGTATLSLPNANTFSGGSTFNGGTVTAGSNTALGTGNVTLTANTTLVAPGVAQSIANPFALNAGQTLSIQAPQVLFLTGPISGPGTLALTSSTSLVLAGPFSYTGGTSLASNAYLQIIHDGSAGAFTGNGTLTLGSSSTGPAKLTLTSSAGTSKLAFLSLLANSQLDLNGNKLIVDPTGNNAAMFSAAMFSSLQSQLLAGQSHNVGIYSSTLPAHTVLALINNATFTTPLTTFGGLPVDTNALFVAPELLGDSNIDGHVDLNDLNTVLNRLGTTDSNWTHGNFDGAATIDLNDLNAVLNNLGLTFAGNASVLAAESLVAASTPAPEPASLPLAGAAIALLITKPHRRDRRLQP